MLRRFLFAGFAAALAAPALAAPPASAVVLFSCSGLSVTSFLTPGLGHNATGGQAYEVLASSTVSSCSNSQTGSIQVGGGTGVGQAFSFPSRPLGCPAAMGGASGNDYPDQTPLLIGSDPSFRINWTAGADSLGITKVKSGGPGTASLHQFRLVLVITSGQYTAPSGQKTKIKGLVNWVPGDTFTCANDSNRITELDISLPASGSLIVNRK